QLATRQKVQFEVKLSSRTLRFPSTPVDIPDSSLFMWPMGLDMDGIMLNYATAQPLWHRGHEWVFLQDVELSPEFSFSTSGVEKVEVAGGRGVIVQKDGAFVVSKLKPGRECVISVVRAG